MINMVTLKEEAKKFDKSDSGITKKTFLSSILSWYPQGVPCHVEQVSKVFSDFSDDPSICITIKINEMDKCRMREIGEDGKPIQIENEYGEKKDKIIEGDASGKKVPLFFKLRYDDEDDLGELFDISSWSAFFPLLNHGCIERELIPEGNKKGFSITRDEIVDALEDLSFIAKSEKVEPNNSKFQPFNKLIVGV